MGKRDAHSENKHHNIPGSRGGSGKEINLSIIPAKRHDQFHSWSWNRTPEMLIRKIILRAVGFEGGHSLSPSALEDVFGEMWVPDWTDLYYPDAVVWLCGKGNKEQALKAEDYATEHLAEELIDTRRTVNALLYDRFLPVVEDDEEFLQRALRFFRTDSPAEAVQQLLTEEHNDDLMWVKPLRDNIRRRLIAIFESAKPISIGASEQSTLVDVLKNHEMYILSSLVHKRSR